jgi:AcrR family transcriptional regulator
MPIDLRRRGDAKLQVSRIAADLFWRNGVAATRGEDIAAAAGIATRTLWRYFRSKESCVEPVLLHSSERFMMVLSAWPHEQSIDDFLGGAATTGPVTYSPDDVRAMRMVSLGFEEPSLRSAWLMVCDDAEQESRSLFARRLQLPADSAEVRRIAASVAGAIRALNDALSLDFIATGREPLSTDVLGQLGSALREASGGRLGAAVDG